MKVMEMIWNAGQVWIFGKSRHVWIKISWKDIWIPSKMSKMFSKNDLERQCWSQSSRWTSASSSKAFEETLGDEFVWCFGCLLNGPFGDQQKKKLGKETCQTILRPLLRKTRMRLFFLNWRSFEDCQSWRYTMVDHGIPFYMLVELETHYVCYFNTSIRPPTSFDRDLDLFSLQE